MSFEYLAIPPLHYEFTVIPTTATADTGLSILIYYRVSNPVATLFSTHLKTQGRHSVTPKDTSSIIYSTAFSALKDLRASNTFLTKSSESAALFSKIRSAVHVSIINQEYDLAVQYLADYSTMVNFSSQPKDHAQLRENSYLEFLFYQYAVNVYSTVLFPSKDPAAFKESSEVGNFKSLDGIYKKIVYYHNRNESLLASCPSERPSVGDDDGPDDACIELKFYWISKVLNLVVLFKKLQFEDFYKEFSSILFASEKSMNFFNQEIGFLKSRILCMFCIVVIFLKPFKDLSLLDFDRQDLVINLFTSDEQSYEHTLYTQLLVPLSQSNFSLVNYNLTTNQTFLQEFSARLGWAVPVSIVDSTQGITKSSSSTARSNSQISPHASISNVSEDSGLVTNGCVKFLQYVKAMITYKNCLSIFSVIEQVPRLKLIELLGFNTRESNDDQLAGIHDQILLLISTLGLGKVGVGYQIDGDIYYNNGPNRQLKAKELQVELHELTSDLKAESIATIMKGVLLEKLLTP